MELRRQTRSPCFQRRHRPRTANSAEGLSRQFFGCRGHRSRSAPSDTLFAYVCEVRQSSPGNACSGVHRTEAGLTRARTEVRTWSAGFQTARQSRLKLNCPARSRRTVVAARPCRQASSSGLARWSRRLGVHPNSAALSTGTRPASRPRPLQDRQNWISLPPGYGPNAFAQHEPAREPRRRSSRLRAIEADRGPDQARLRTYFIGYGYAKTSCSCPDLCRQKLENKP